jgi:hypothetical protein
MNQRPRRNVYWPRPVKVDAGSNGVPSAVESVAVVAVREEWLVEDSWWTPRPLRRRYFELVLADGRNVVVFCEPAPASQEGRAVAGERSHSDGTELHEQAPTGRWFLQRA